MSNREKLDRFFALFTGTSKVLVVINADPDAIARLARDAGMKYLI